MELLVKALLVCHHHWSEQEGDMFWKVAVMAAETLSVESEEDRPSYANYRKDFLERIHRLRDQILPSLPESQHETIDHNSAISCQQTKSIHDLPPELIYNIAECLAYPTRDQIGETQAALATASRACKFWHHIFSTVLYRCPKFKNALEMDRFLAVTLKFTLAEGKSPWPVQQIALYRGEKDLWLGDYLLQYRNESQEEFPFPNTLFLHLAKTYPRLKRVFFVEENGEETELEVMKIIIEWVRDVETLHSSVEGIFDTFDNMQRLIPENVYPAFLDSALKTCLPLLDILLAESDFLNEHSQKLIASDPGRFEVMFGHMFSPIPGRNRRLSVMRVIRRMLPDSYTSLPLPSPKSSSQVWEFATMNDKRTLLYKARFINRA